MHDGDTDNNPGNTIKAGLKKDEETPKRLTEATMGDPKLMFNWGPFKGKRPLDDDKRDPLSKLNQRKSGTSQKIETSETSSNDIHQVILNDGERLIADKVVKFPRLNCRLKFEQNGKLLLRDDDQGKLFQSETEGPEALIMSLWKTVN